MIRIQVTLKTNGEPLKRIPVRIEPDVGAPPAEVYTDRNGTAVFDLPPLSGKVLVDGVPRHHGLLAGDIAIELWSVLEGSAVAASGAPGNLPSGSTAYPGMQTKTIRVGERDILTDSEGYLVDLGDWSEDFARALAAAEDLTLTEQHWEVIRFLRDYYAQHGVQAQVREMIKHFKNLWGAEQGSNHALHDLFPRGGPQKQGNRLAGLLRTKGEH